MVELKLIAFWDLAHALEDFEMQFIFNDSRGHDIREDVKAKLQALRDMCLDLGLYISTRTLDRAIENVPDVASELRIILNVVKDQMESLLVVYISPDRALYYERDYEWSIAFPSAAFDVRQAGNCYAAGLDTAAVYHCMRALELGLYALAVDTKALTGRPLDTLSWNTILEAITTAIEKYRGGRGITSADPKVVFWSDAASQFFIFKEAWRNRTAHVRAIYTQDQSTKILDATAHFMEQLEKGGLKE